MRRCKDPLEAQLAPCYRVPRGWVRALFMEASTLTPAASRAGILGRRSPLLKLQGDERLVALIREGHDHAFEVLFERYHSRLLAFCRHMLRSTEDAEDVLQEVFVKAHAAMLADDRHINVRPWLYRIARNRCLNHLRRPVPEGQDSMDVMVGENGVTTADRVQKREDFRALVADVQDLPETQRTALLLRELDALSYEEIAETMDTTIPAVKSLLVRARMSLAEATHSRQLTCGEVRLELAEAAEGLRKASGPVRHHVKRCEACGEFRGQLRSNTKTLAALAPIGPLALALKGLIAKFGWGGSSGAATGSATSGSGIAGSTGAVAGASGAGAGGAAAGAGAGTAVAGGAAAGGAAAVGGGGAAFGGAAAGGGIAGAIGAKAAATAATAALLTAGAVEVRQIYSDSPVDRASEKHAPAQQAYSPPPAHGEGKATYHPAEPAVADQAPVTAAAEAKATGTAATEPATMETPGDAATADVTDPAATSGTEDEAVVGPAAGGSGSEDDTGASGSSAGDVLVTEATPTYVGPTTSTATTTPTPTTPPATTPPPPPVSTPPTEPPATEPPATTPPPPPADDTTPPASGGIVAP